eukprot:CAMPEP_0177665642 /NCGR_PEP_ID=MMETSP0447-20121125/21164_1 /TAXON_ID=0 /ORGANISM="Stygamoeba regulata, Strain BSH-02190019" /LENGTH=283 /DNA_ID=CAMNT_0019171751 /DNA_START=267 /DNA_END=1118 /DNA_ORIENTATION=+
MTMPGFLPPIIILAFTGLWTAPPFVYNPKKYEQLFLHVFTSFLWIVLIFTQIHFIETNHWYHKLTGIVLAGVLIGFFVMTAIFSAFWVGLSPLGHFVQWMELGLGVGISLYMILAFYFAFTGDYESHKISIVAMACAAGGPGIFRSLRTTRELVSGRLLNVRQYGHYWDVLDCASGVRDNFVDVEATYFIAAFLTTDVLQYLFYVWIGKNEHPLVWLFCGFPLVWILLGIGLRRYAPTLKFSLAANYTFNIVRTNRTQQPQYQEPKPHEQSNPAAPVSGTEAA